MAHDDSPVRSYSIVKEIGIKEIGRPARNLIHAGLARRCNRIVVGSTVASRQSGRRDPASKLACRR